MLFKFLSSLSVLRGLIRRISELARLIRSAKTERLAIVSLSIVTLAIVSLVIVTKERL